MIAADLLPEASFIPQNVQGTYTCVLGDSGKHLYKTGASNGTWTIPANSSVSYQIGTVLTFVNDGNSGVVMSIAITTDTLVFAVTGSTGTRSLARFGIATALKVTSTRWLISGSGLT